MTEEIKKDWRTEDINRLKARMNKWRGIFVIIFIIALVPMFFDKIFTANTLISMKMYNVFYWIFWFGLTGWYLTHSLKIIKAWENGVPFFLGKARKSRKSGPTLILWPLEKIVFISIWQRESDIPAQSVVIKDGVANVDGLVVWKIIDAKKFMVNIKEPEKVLIDLALAAFRSAAGIRTTDQLKDDSKQISVETTQYLNDLTSQKDWGIEVVSAQLTRVDPPAEVATAMAKFAAAQREKQTIETLAEAAKAKRAREAEAEANFIKMQVAAYGSIDDYLKMEFTKALKNGDKFVLGGLMDTIEKIFGKKI
jgi:regulator of protease activity HflC (stomatin/prohibitin superfamily)